MSRMGGPGLEGVGREATGSSAGLIVPSIRDCYHRPEGSVNWDRLIEESLDLLVLYTKVIAPAPQGATELEFKTTPHQLSGRYGLHVWRLSVSAWSATVLQVHRGALQTHIASLAIRTDYQRQLARVSSQSLGGISAAWAG